MQKIQLRWFTHRCQNQYQGCVMDDLTCRSMYGPSYWVDVWHLYIYIYIYIFWSLYLVLHTDWQELNFESIQTIFPVIGIPIIKIKWFWDHIYNWNSYFSMMSSVYWDSVQDIKHVYVMICYGIVCEQGKSENTAYACQPLSKKNILWIGLWYCCMDAWHLGAVSIRKMVLPGMAIPMLKIRRPNGRLIFNMEIAIRR